MGLFCTAQGSLYLNYNPSQLFALILLPHDNSGICPSQSRYLTEFEEFIRISINKIIPYMAHNRPIQDITTLLGHLNGNKSFSQHHAITAIMTNCNSSLHHLLVRILYKVYIQGIYNGNPLNITILKYISTAYNSDESNFFLAFSHHFGLFKSEFSPGLSSLYIQLSNNRPSSITTHTNASHLINAKVSINAARVSMAQYLTFEYNKMAREYHTRKLELKYHLRNSRRSYKSKPVAMPNIHSTINAIQKLLDEMQTKIKSIKTDKSEKCSQIIKNIKKSANSLSSFEKSYMSPIIDTKEYIITNDKNSGEYAKLQAFFNLAYNYINRLITETYNTIDHTISIIRFTGLNILNKWLNLKYRNDYKSILNSTTHNLVDLINNYKVPSNDYNIIEMLKLKVTITDNINKFFKSDYFNYNYHSHINITLLTSYIRKSIKNRSRKLNGYFGLGFIHLFGQYSALLNFTRSQYYFYKGIDVINSILLAHDSMLSTLANHTTSDAHPVPTIFNLNMLFNLTEQSSNITHVLNLYKRKYGLQFLSENINFYQSLLTLADKCEHQRNASFLNFNCDHTHQFSVNTKPKVMLTALLQLFKRDKMALLINRTIPSYIKNATPRHNMGKWPHIQSLFQFLIKLEKLKKGEYSNIALEFRALLKELGRFHYGLGKLNFYFNSYQTNHTYETSKLMRIPVPEDPSLYKNLSIPRSIEIPLAVNNEAMSRYTFAIKSLFHFNIGLILNDPGSINAMGVLANKILEKDTFEDQQSSNKTHLSVLTPEDVLFLNNFTRAMFNLSIEMGSVKFAPYNLAMFHIYSPRMYDTRNQINRSYFAQNVSFRKEMELLSSSIKYDYTPASTLMGNVHYLKHKIHCKRHQFLYGYVEKFMDKISEIDRILGETRREWDRIMSLYNTAQYSMESLNLAIENESSSEPDSNFNLQRKVHAEKVTMLRTKLKSYRRILLELYNKTDKISRELGQFYHYLTLNKLNRDKMCLESLVQYNTTLSDGADIKEEMQVAYFLYHHTHSPNRQDTEHRMLSTYRSLVLYLKIGFTGNADAYASVLHILAQADSDTVLYHYLESKLYPLGCNFSVQSTRGLHQSSIHNLRELRVYILLLLANQHHRCDAMLTLAKLYLFSAREGRIHCPHTTVNKELAIVRDIKRSRHYLLRVINRARCSQYVPEASIHLAMIYQLRGVQDIGMYVQRRLADSHLYQAIVSIIRGVRAKFNMRGGLGLFSGIMQLDDAIPLDFVLSKHYIDKCVSSHYQYVATLALYFTNLHWWTHHFLFSVKVTKPGRNRIMNAILYPYNALNDPTILPISISIENLILLFAAILLCVLLVEYT